MSTEQLRRMFRGDKLDSSKSGGQITRLYRTIMKDMGFNYEDQIQAINQWLADPHGGGIKSYRELSETRGNYVRLITKPKMTIRTFYALLRMWYPESVTLTVTIKWREAYLGTSSHSVTTNFPARQHGPIDPDLAPIIEIINDEE